MYIVTLGVLKGKRYLNIWEDGSHWEWVTAFKQATRFKTYVEAKDALRLAVARDKISDATIYGY